MGIEEYNLALTRTIFDQEGCFTSTLDNDLSDADLNLIKEDPKERKEMVAFVAECIPASEHRFIDDSLTDNFIDALKSELMRIFQEVTTSPSWHKRESSWMNHALHLSKLQFDNTAQLDAQCKRNEHNKRANSATNSSRGDCQENLSSRQGYDEAMNQTDVPVQCKPQQFAMNNATAKLGQLRNSPVIRMATPPHRNNMVMGDSDNHVVCMPAGPISPSPTQQQQSPLYINNNNTNNKDENSGGSPFIVMQRRQPMYMPTAHPNARKSIETCVNDESMPACNVMVPSHLQQQQQLQAQQHRRVPSQSTPMVRSNLACADAARQRDIADASLYVQPSDITHPHYMPANPVVAAQQLLSVEGNAYQLRRPLSMSNEQLQFYPNQRPVILPSNQLLYHRQSLPLDRRCIVYDANGNAMLMHRNSLYPIRSKDGHFVIDGLGNVPVAALSDGVAPTDSPPTMIRFPNRRIPPMFAPDGSSLDDSYAAIPNGFVGPLRINRATGMIGAGGVPIATAGPMLLHHPRMRFIDHVNSQGGYTPLLQDGSPVVSDRFAPIQQPAHQFISDYDLIRLRNGSMIAASSTDRNGFVMSGGGSTH